MNSRGCARICLFVFAILPGTALAQEPATTFNAPPNGVLKQPTQVEATSQPPAKLVETKAKPASTAAVKKASALAANKPVSNTKPSPKPEVSVSAARTPAKAQASIKAPTAQPRTRATSRSLDSGLARINTERVNVRKGPGEEFVRFILLDKETRVRALAAKGDWVRISLPGGGDGWLRRKFIDLPQTANTMNPPVQAKQSQPAPVVAASALPISSSKPAGLTTTKQTVEASKSLPDVRVTAAKPPQTSVAGITQTASLAAGARPVNQPVSEGQVAAAKAPVPSPVASGPLTGTKPDLVERTQESPAEAMRDGWKLMLYLVPMLALIVLAIRGLKAVQQKTGWLPGVKQGLLGSVNLTNARKTGGSSIRVLESVPLGTVGLHLVEIKGRSLLLGTSGATVSVLTEVNAAGGLERTDFSALLNAAAEEIGSNELVDGSLNSAVASIDDSLRDARELIGQNAAAVRHWTEM